MPKQSEPKVLPSEQIEELHQIGRDHRLSRYASALLSNHAQYPKEAMFEFPDDIRHTVLPYSRKVLGEMLDGYAQLQRNDLVVQHGFTHIVIDEPDGTRSQPPAEAFLLSESAKARLQAAIKK